MRAHNKALDKVAGDDSLARSELVVDWRWTIARPARTDAGARTNVTGHLPGTALTAGGCDRQDRRLILRICAQSVLAPMLQPVDRSQFREALPHP